MTSSKLYPQVLRTFQSAFHALFGAVVLLASLTVASKPAVAQFVGPTQLTLVNGWSDAAFTTSHATVEMQNYIVRFRGAISGGTAAVAFTLPAAFRPATDVYVPVDLCNANKGRLHITPAGVVDIEVENVFSDAQCFTSLDGATYSPNTNGYTALTLINGWTNGPFSTSNAAIRSLYGFVLFKGAIATSGTNPSPFTVPVGYRPATDVYVPVDLCNANNGRLHITPAGAVDVEVEGGTFSNAQCFTSLDGAWFAQSVPSSNVYPLTLQNGWTNAPFSTSNAAAADQYGVVRLKGAIATGGTNAVPFTLPPRFAPVTNVYVNVDLCGANKGRLWIQPSGLVTVQAEKSFADAQCFTSLDGVSFVQ